MSDDSSGEKTEEPTAKRLSDAVDEGNVPNAEKQVQILLTIAGMIIGFFTFNLFADLVKQLFVIMFQAPIYDFKTMYLISGSGMVRTLLVYMIPIIFLLAVMTVVATIATSGFIFSSDKLAPSFDKLNPVSKIKSLFTMSTIYDLMLVITFISIEFFIIYKVLSANLEDYMQSLDCGLVCLKVLFKDSVWEVILYTILILIIWLIFDKVIKVKEYIENLKMTRDEVTREYKEMEGDPEIKGQRKEFAREIVEGASINDVRFVIAGNGMALGFAYDREQYPIPTLIFKTQDERAQAFIGQMRSMRRPVVPEGRLAAEVVSEIALGQPIKRKFFRDFGQIVAKCGV